MERILSLPQYSFSKLKIYCVKIHFINILLVIRNLVTTQKASHQLPFRHGIKLSKEQVPKNEHEEQFMSRVPYEIGRAHV